MWCSSVSVEDMDTSWDAYKQTSSVGLRSALLRKEGSERELKRVVGVELVCLASDF